MLKTIIFIISFFCHVVSSFFAGRLNISPNCSRDIKELYSGLRHQELWALTMLDSMDKIPSGLLLGRGTALGQFDECLKVVQPNFTGKHCVVELALKRANSNITLLNNPSLFLRVALGQFSYGVCIPSSCSSTDLKKIIRMTGLNQLFVTEVNESKCAAELNLNLRTKDYIVIGLFWLVVALSLASTAYDVHHKFFRKSETQSEILTSFSLQSNLKLLFHAEEGSREMTFLHGIRFFSFAWMVFGHLYLLENKNSTDVNVFDKLTAITSKSSVHGSNAYLCVDTFFFVSGLLVCFLFFRHTSEKGSYDAPLMFIRRYLRLTPSLAVLILFNSTILSRITVAPYAKLFLEETEKHCQTGWWIYLLHIQNLFYLESKTCFPPAWYISVEMQLFLISPLILYVLLLWPKFAAKYLFVLTLGSSTISFVISYIDDLPPNRTLHYALKSNSGDEYRWFHTRMAPWLVGIATGYIICGLKTKIITFRLKKVGIAVCWIVSALLCLTSLYGIVAFFPYETALDHPAIEKSAYRSFHRLGWALGLSWIVIACVSGYGGMINSLLSCNIFRPLSKLSYCAFLTHHSLQAYRSINEYKTVKYYSPLRMTYTFLGDLALSLVLAIPMTLLVEMPFSHIQRILLKNLEIFPYPKSTKVKP